MSRDRIFSLYFSSLICFRCYFITRTLHSLTHGTVPHNRETAIISIDRAVAETGTATSSVTEKRTSDQGQPYFEEGRVMGRVEMSKCLGSSSCHSGRTDFTGTEVFTRAVCPAIHEMIIEQGRNVK